MGENDRWVDDLKCQLGTTKPILGIGGLGDDHHRPDLVESRGQRRSGAQKGSRLVAPGDR